MPASCSVFLNVRDLAKSQKFYEALGFKKTGGWPDDAGVIRYIDLEFGGAELSIGDIAANDDPEFRKWVSGELGPGVMVNFTVPDVKRVWAKAQKANATIESPLMDHPYGKMFILNDPDGYVVTFGTPPKKRAAAKKRAPAKKKAAKKSARKAPARTARKAAKRSAKKAAGRGRKARA